MAFDLERGKWGWSRECGHWWGAHSTGRLQRL